MLISGYFKKTILICLVCFLSLHTFGQELPSLDFLAGKALFEKNWIPAPASTQASDGLGPYYNARSCNQCHPDGGSGSREQSLVLHIDDPVYGQQLQKFAVNGLPVEGRVEFNPENNASEYHISGLHYGPLQTTGASARIASSLSGLGLLEAIPESVITALADEQDLDGDGISGRMNRIEGQVGRFGWKAAQPTLETQIARALSLDLGLGNPLHPSAYGDCTELQHDCMAMPHGISFRQDNLEADATVVSLLLTYVRGLPAPPEYAYSVQASDGSRLFSSTGCAACHVPTLQAGEKAIHAYTDLLIHDMGPGLADTLEEGVAQGSEWRTAPLWGLNKKTGTYLHDGRARTLEEAILWHGGESEGARKQYESLSPAQRDDLITFLLGL